jgi:hypothetical protein
MISLHQAVMILMASWSSSHDPLALQFRFTKQVVDTPKAQEIEGCREICARDAVGLPVQIALIRSELRPGERWRLERTIRSQAKN